MRFFAPLVCGIVLSAASLMGSGDLSGRRAPGFSLPDSNLTNYDLQDYRGKIVLIEMMQTGCPECSVFARTLEKAKEKYGDKIQILSVVTFPPDNLRNVEEFIAKFKVTYPILFDCGQMSRSYLKVTIQTPNKPLPHLFIIDRNGMIVNDFEYDWTTRNVFEGDALFAMLDQMLGHKPPAAKKR